MSKTKLRPGSLVLYKNRPARIIKIDSKIKIEREGGETLRVRPKDITPLHPGPLEDFGALVPQQGEVKVAWEILIGRTTHLAELAELIYGTYTPATAWAAWELVEDGLYFEGSPQEIVIHSPDEVAQEREDREAKAAKERAWAAFLERVQAGQFAPEDEGYLREVEALALGQRENSRVLQELGRAERPENAHALLLELGYWDATVNPYPHRLGLPTTPPVVQLSDLPQEERLDLTHLPAFAIDDEYTQDPDDALSLEGERLWVHVADVAALVTPESTADREARARGANLYLPEGTVPMLPPKATRILGLGLTDVSPALSFGLDLSSEGEVLGVEVAPSWVQVTRLTYAEANARLDEEPFRSLHRIAQTYEARRRQEGAITLDLPEVTIHIVEGEIVIRPLLQLESRNLVTEAMLMTGEAVAQFALERDMPFVFSTQPPPHAEVSEQPDGLAGMYAILRTLQRSQMTSVPAPHAGLGLQTYTRVTSPLRRYLDLVVHQQLRAYVRGQELLETQEMLERIGAAEAVSGEVRWAERLSRQHWTSVYLQRRPDWRGEGIVVEKRGSRAKVLIPTLDLETWVHVRESQLLNSRVSLTLSGVDLPELEAHFSVER